MMCMHCFAPIDRLVNGVITADCTECRRAAYLAKCIGQSLIAHEQAKLNVSRTDGDCFRRNMDPADGRFVSCTLAKGHTCDHEAWTTEGPTLLIRWNDAPSLSAAPPQEDQ